MAQAQPTQLTDKQHKQLKDWLWDADRTMLRYILENICETNPIAAALAYQQAPCKDYVVAEHDADPSSLSGRRRADDKEFPSSIASQAAVQGHNEGRKVLGSEAHENGTRGQFMSSNAPIGTTDTTTTAKVSGLPVPPIPIPTEGSTDFSNSGKMSLASMLQPSTALTSDQPLTKKRKLEHNSPRRLVICKKCGCPYEVHKDDDELCTFHPGDLEHEAGALEEEPGWKSEGDIQVQAPELFTWSCCERSGEEPGCQQGRHRRHDHQNLYAELRLRRARGQSTDIESSDS